MKSIIIELKWAGIFLIAGLLWMVLEKLAGLHGPLIYLHPYLTMLFMIPAVWIFVLALLDKKKNFYEGQMNFGEGFLTGFIMSVIVMLFSPLTQWITIRFISPEFFPNAIEYSLETGYFKTLAEASTYFSLNNYILQSIIGAIVMGVATSLVVAFFVRTRKAV